MKINPFSEGGRISFLWISPRLLLTMKLLFFLLTATLSQVWATGYSQTIGLDERNSTIESVLKTIEKQTDYLFLYDKLEISELPKVSIRTRNATIEQSLDQLFRGLPLSYKIFNKTIVIKRETKKDDKAVLTPVLVPQPDPVLRGKVTDERGENLPGVSIVVKGTQQGTTTNADGIFEIKISESLKTLIFSYVGYVPQEVEVTGKIRLDMVLKTDIKALNEIVVVGYGTQKRSDITSSIGYVGAKQIQNEQVQQIGQSLQGKLPGIQISQNSGAPGSPLMIRIRGAGTVNNSQPLYVIDGNPNSDPTDLVPEQVESIQVLKSASAAAIYGARGANGVILITTKQGKAGKTQLDLNFSQGYQQVQRMLPVTNAREFATLYNEALVNGGQQPAYPDAAQLGEGTNWQKEIFRVAPMTNLQVSASGGSESSKFYFSAGYFNQEGIVRGSGYDRLNLRVNSSHTINPVLKIGQNLSLSYAEYKQLSEFSVASIVNATVTANPTIPVRDANGNWGSSPTALNAVNPLASISFNNNDTQRPVVNGNVYAEIIPLKALVFRSQLNFNYGYSENTSFSPVYDISPLNRNLVARLGRQSTRFKELAWENTLTYTKAIGKHQFDLLGGITTQDNTVELISANGEGIPENSNINPNLRYLDLATSGQRVGGNAGSYGMLSYLGRVNYNYNDKYFTTVNFRADGSSRFGPNNKFGYFPSFSVGWKLSNEPFLKEIRQINSLMLRGGWGSLGNQNSLSNYAFADLVTSNINYVFGSSQTVARGQAPIGVGNPNLKWEATKETSVGIDFTGFDNKITASVDYYYKKTTDMLLRVPVVQYSGIQLSPFENGGDVVNKGFELSLGYQDTTPSGFSYSINGNVSHNKNEVTKLNNGTALYTQISFVGIVGISQVGSPVASFYGWQTDGLFQNKAEIDAHAFQSVGTAPGDIRFVDLNKDGKITAADQTIIGNPWPKLTYGLNTDFKYKNFDLRMNLQGVYGNDVYMGMKFRLEGSNFFNYSKASLNHWSGEGTSTTIPRLNVNDPNNNFRSSDYYLSSGSYLRVKNIQIGYRIPKEVIKLRNLRVYASISNALTISKYWGFDPEIGSNRNNDPLYIGIDEGNYPLPRIYTFGVNIGL